METWEYKFVQMKTDGHYKDPDGSANFDVHITELGRLGWDLTALTWQTVYGHAVFRRPIDPDSETYTPIEIYDNLPG